MRPVTRDEIPDLDEYEARREAVRAEMIRVRARRRVELGELVSLGFENRDTVRYQVCEMMRAERIRDERRLMEELEVYNDLIPGPGQLSCTLFIEVPDQSQIRTVLNRMVGVDEHLTLRVGDVAVPGESEPGRSTLEKTASVHYVKWTLPPEAQRRMRAGEGAVEIACDHPNYRRSVMLTPAQVAELARDLDE
ncbi:MAG: DUF3501 family protein [Firmicutes bacterium]|nr:DUF3501 family protein [Bacillota bacterium]